MAEEVAQLEVQRGAVEAAWREITAAMATVPLDAPDATERINALAALARSKNAEYSALQTKLLLARQRGNGGGNGANSGGQCSGRTTRSAARAAKRELSPPPPPPPNEPAESERGAGNGKEEKTRGRKAARLSTTTATTAAAVTQDSRAEPQAAPVSLTGKNITSSSTLGAIALLPAGADADTEAEVVQLRQRVEILQRSQAVQAEQIADLRRALQGGLDGLRQEVSGRMDDEHKASLRTAVMVAEGNRELSKKIAEVQMEAATALMEARRPGRTRPIGAWYTDPEGMPGQAVIVFENVRARIDNASRHMEARPCEDTPIGSLYHYPFLLSIYWNGDRPEASGNVGLYFVPKRPRDDLEDEEGNKITVRWPPPYRIRVTMVGKILTLDPRGGDKEFFDEFPPVDNAKGRGQMRFCPHSSALWTLQHDCLAVTVSFLPLFPRE